MEGEVTNKIWRERSLIKYGGKVTNKIWREKSLIKYGGRSH